MAVAKVFMNTGIKLSTCYPLFVSLISPAVFHFLQRKNSVQKMTGPLDLLIVAGITSVARGRRRDESDRANPTTPACGRSLSRPFGLVPVSSEAILPDFVQRLSTLSAQYAVAATANLQMPYFGGSDISRRSWARWTSGGCLTRERRARQLTYR
jgi:hypothetical protein